MSRWNSAFQALSESDRNAVNNLTNAIFQAQTGFTGKINPKAQPQYAAKWLEIRDTIMRNRQAFAEFLRAAMQEVSNIAAALKIYQLADTVPAWIKYARAEIGEKEIPGSKHNPRIMEYIRTCTNIQQTDAQKRYVEREGEEGVEWCSAFVNWCLAKAGIQGTDNALASSWQTWGTAIPGPRRGAIVGFNWSGTQKIDHVAFCDEVDGVLRRLGGNQGSPGEVSSEMFSKSTARYYRWPRSA
jgi:uncharacterized protein (TIGR02594 family)